jgi:hypothetical protein
MLATTMCSYNHDGNIIGIPINFQHACVKIFKKIEKICWIKSLFLVKKQEVKIYSTEHAQ